MSEFASAAGAGVVRVTGTAKMLTRAFLTWLLVVGYTYSVSYYFYQTFQRQVAAQSHAKANTLKEV